jgi:hypothetical protein
LKPKSVNNDLEDLNSLIDETLTTNKPILSSSIQSKKYQMISTQNNNFNKTINKSTPVSSNLFKTTTSTNISTPNQIVTQNSSSYSYQEHQPQTILGNLTPVIISESKPKDEIDDIVTNVLKAKADGIDNLSSATKSGIAMQ